MRLIKSFGLAALAIALTAAIGASSASALEPAQLCKAHLDQLECPEGQATIEDHQVLAPGTVWKLLSPIPILCLGALKVATPLGLGKPQLVHTLKLTLEGCGTGSAHNNCTITVEELPLLHLLKTGLDEGVLTALNGSLIIQCQNIFVDCLIDLAGAQLSMGGQHTTADEVSAEPLGGKFLCPSEPVLDFLLVTLEDHFVLR